MRIARYIAAIVICGALFVVWDATKAPVICVSAKSGWVVLGPHWRDDDNLCSYMHYDDPVSRWFHPEERWHGG